MSDLIISSLQNDQVKTLVKLRNRRARDKQGLTVIEEPLVIARALEAGYPLRTVYFCPEHLNDAGRRLLADLRATTGLRSVEMTAPVMTKASYRDHPEGLLVVAPQVKTTLEDLKERNLSGSGPLVILEAVEKPGNLGAILRIADGAGAAAVLICGQGTDLFNPNVLRASRGAFFHLPTVEAPAEKILAFCAARGVTTVAASPAARADYTATDLARPLALVLGTEHDGLSPRMLAACDITVGIPMLGAGDSLNVASSAAVLLYEALRQRRGG
ncbi:rRNA methyltransferase [bacterium DOLJORAL78_65_58]|nr:MAG: rRNA methyltransferase [bacterium DOLZORAL124_64_63]PIE76394.1 MAG: rRNA methyltransferase [bacterium DOLJORAL78_65_58]